MRVAMFVPKSHRNIKISGDDEVHCLEFDLRYMWDFIKEKRYLNDIDKDLKMEMEGAEKIRYYLK
jgi:hypothetical protein